jgi:Tfp pilus assembly protein PilX
MMRGKQCGAVLVVSLVMLVVLTLFVLSSTRIATGNLRIVGNFQSKQNVEAVAQSVIEQVLSAITPFYTPTGTVTLSAGTIPTGMTVTVGNRTCVRATPAPGYSAVSGVSPEDTFWHVPVTVNDTITNTSRTISQGVRIRLPAGNCL